MVDEEVHDSLGDEIHEVLPYDREVGGDQRLDDIHFDDLSFGCLRCGLDLLRHSRKSG